MGNSKSYIEWEMEDSLCQAYIDTKNKIVSQINVSPRGTEKSSIPQGKIERKNKGFYLIIYPKLKSKCQYLIK